MQKKIKLIKLIRAGLLPWCLDQHIFHYTVFAYILLDVFY